MRFIEEGIKVELPVISNYYSVWNLDGVIALLWYVS